MYSQYSQRECSSHGAHIQRFNMRLALNCENSIGEKHGVCVFRGYLFPVHRGELENQHERH